MQENPLRVALFGSFYRGFNVLQGLLKIQAESGEVKVVGVATDNPRQTFVSPEKRVWQYPHTEAEATMVARLAKENHIDIYDGKVKTAAFYEIFEHHWKPDICYMATFGQLINKRLFEYPSLGFFNLHPSTDQSWPSYAGGNPFQLMLDAGENYCVITLHKVDEKFDHGDLVDVSERLILPEAATVPDMHKLTSPTAAKLALDHLESKLDEFINTQGSD